MNLNNCYPLFKSRQFSRGPHLYSGNDKGSSRASKAYKIVSAKMFHAKYWNSENFDLDCTISLTLALNCVEVCLPKSLHSTHLCITNCHYTRQLYTKSTKKWLQICQKLLCWFSFSWISCALHESGIFQTLNSSVFRMCTDFRLNLNQFVQIYDTALVITCKKPLDFQKTVSLCGA